MVKPIFFPSLGFLLYRCSLLVIRAYIHSSRIILHYIYIKPLYIGNTMKNILRENMKRFKTKNILIEDVSAQGTTTITGLRLKQATIKREGMYVKVSFSRNDMEESSYAGMTMDGTCDILLFMKNGKIDYSNAYCVTEDDRDYPEMQKFVEFRLDLPAAADTNNFSQNILTAFGK